MFKMLGRAFILVAFLAINVQSADHNTFKNCSRVEFCNDLRYRTLTEKQVYSAILDNVTIEDGVANIPLKNENEELTLTVTALEGEKYRIIIKESGSQRYQLSDVLKEEPKALKLESSQDDSPALILSVADAKSKVVVSNSPLSIKFYLDDVESLSISGSKLIMYNNESTESFAFSTEFPQAKQLYGIHEHADILALRNTKNGDPYRLRNLDVSGYEINSTMSLYGAIPVLYGHGVTHTSGIFLHNAAEQWYEIEDNQAYIMVESALMDIFVLLGPKPKDVVRQYTSLTGVHHLPQLWTLGYHQCRWNYDNQSDVMDVIANMDKNDFPMDAMWLDIEYSNGKRYFTWNPENFTNPAAMLKNISSTNRKLVTIIDPHIFADNSYEVYEGAKNKRLFVRNDDDSDFIGECWPGNSSYMDFLNPEARAYYAKSYSNDSFWFNDDTLAGIWNDMNEPSVFDNSLEKTMPGNAIHYDKNGTLVKHRDIHNIYGLLHTMSTHDGLMKRDNNTKRPFILTRSHFAGTQRYAAIWTGDNQIGWDYLRVSYSECLNANILGIAFCGADIGGFEGNNLTKELLRRWYQAAAWTPFFREHSTLGSARREPYLWDETTQSIIRDAMKLRYKHLPVWYTLFYEHTRNGDPVLRPLFYHYPEDDKVFSIDDQLLVGNDILVRAIYEPGVKEVNVYFPGGEDQVWYSINSNAFYKGTGSQTIKVDDYSIPIYYRGGSIIARKDMERRSSAEMVDDCYTIYINLDKNGQASGNIYVDDYTSFEYENKNYTYKEISYNKADDFISVKAIDDDATQAFDIFICRVVVNDAYSNSAGKYTTKVRGLTVGETKSS